MILFHKLVQITFKHKICFRKLLRFIVNLLFIVVVFRIIQKGCYYSTLLNKFKSEVDNKLSNKP